MQISLPENCTANTQTTGYTLQSCKAPCDVNGETNIFPRDCISKTSGTSKASMTTIKKDCTCGHYGHACPSRCAKCMASGPTRFYLSAGTSINIKFKTKPTLVVIGGSQNLQFLNDEVRLPAPAYSQCVSTALTSSPSLSNLSSLCLMSDADYIFAWHGITFNANGMCH